MSTDASAATGPREIETDRRTNTASPTPVRKANHLFAAVALAIGLIIVAGLVAVLWESAKLNRPVAAAAAMQSNVPDSAAAAPLPPPAPASVNSAPAILATARLLALRTVAAEARAELEKLDSELRGWKTALAEIMEGDAGKRLAADDGLLDRFLIIFDRERPSETHVESLKQQLDVLAGPIDEAFRNGNAAFAPERSYVTEIERIEDALKEAAAAYRGDREMLHSLLQESAKQTPVTRAFAERLQERRQANARQRLETIEAQSKAAREEAVRLVGAAEADAIKKKAEAEAEAKRLLGESESQQLIADAESRKKILEDEFARRRGAEEMASLRRRAEDSEVQRRYSPFLEKGRLRFDAPPTSNYLAVSAELERVSWGQLNANGWLSDVKSFARALTSQPLVENHHYVNDRRTWPYPTTEAEWKVRQAMLEEFKQLGPIWVEMRLLNP